MTPAELITRAFMLIVNRPPTDDEIKQWISLINDIINEVEKI